jgi:hypothetical protein
MSRVSARVCLCCGLCKHWSPSKQPLHSINACVCVCGVVCVQVPSKQPLLSINTYVCAVACAGASRRPSSPSMSQRAVQGQWPVVPSGGSGQWVLPEEEVGPTVIMASGVCACGCKCGCGCGCGCVGACASARACVRLCMCACMHVRTHIHTDITEAALSAGKVQQKIH